ncbi:MAG: MerR family transcriptional regulator [Lachnospiraceae bacterium]
MDSKEELLSISEMASLRKVTPETLRYYDRIGLLEPNYIDPQTGYRYYSIRQYEKIGTIKELRELGLSIREIRDYFSDRELAKSDAILSAYYDHLQEEIRNKLKLSGILAKKLHFLDEIRQPAVTDVVYTRDFDRRRILTFHERAGSPKAHALAFTRLEQYLPDPSPILATDRVGVLCDADFLVPVKSVRACVPMILLGEEKTDGPTDVLPAGRYLCLDYRGGALEESHPSFALILDALRQENLAVSGPILQLYRIDKTLTDREDETMLELQVPVRPQD